MKKRINMIPLILSMAVLIVGVFMLGTTIGEDLRDMQTNRQLKGVYENENAEVIPDGSGETEVDPGLLKLHEDNPDCIGWLYVDGTPIDYPVMYHSDETGYYLHRNFFKEYSSAGSLYLSENCDPEVSMNQIIYGHHMKNGSMFASLEKYKDQDFYEKYPYIEYRTLHGNEFYKIIAAFQTSVYTSHDFKYYAFTTPKDEQEFYDFMEEVDKHSYYDTGISPTFGDQLLTLSTCEYSTKNGRMVVIAKRVEPKQLETHRKVVVL